MKRSILAIPTIWGTSIAVAAEQTSSTPSSGLFQLVFGLLIVLGLIAATAWTLKYFGVKQKIGGTNIRIVGGVNVGTRERILIVEAADQWIVVGITPGSINALATMPKQENVPVTDGTNNTADTKTFPEWLKKTLEKRNGK